jgi:hypothetical protein
VPRQPECKQEQPFKAALEGDLKTVLAGGEHALLELVMATHAGTTTEEFAQIVEDWLGSARHPKTGRFCSDMVFQQCSSCSPVSGATVSRPALFPVAA